MNIQNISNTNFGATKILTARQVLPKGKLETIDIFKLNHEADSEFIEKCCNVFSNVKTRNLKLFERRCKSLFSDLLVKANAMSEDFYLAIKNNETIVGCMNSVPFMKDVIPLNLFMRDAKPQNINTMFLAFLNDSKKSYNGFNIKMDSLATKTIANENVISFDKIDEVNGVIKNEYPNIKFNSKVEMDVNLEDFLGIRNFETEFYPNLK